MSEPVKIAIVLEGGIVQAVLTAGIPVEYAVIDYDCEGGDAGIVAVPQSAGETADAYVSAPLEAEQGDGAWVLAALNRFGAGVDE